MARFRVLALFREKFLGHSPQQIFSRMYERNSWGNTDSFSGDGLDLTQTHLIRVELPKLIESLGIETMLDAPCGDYFWMKSLNLQLKRYVGVDIVPALAQANQEKYGSDSVSFKNIDITRDELPAVGPHLVPRLPGPSVIASRARCPAQFQEERLAVSADDDVPESAQDQQAVAHHWQLASA